MLWPFVVWVSFVGYFGWMSWLLWGDLRRRITEEQIKRTAVVAGGS